MTDTEAEQFQQMRVALMNIRAIARREQSHPTRLHMTAFSIIEKNADAALTGQTAVTSAMPEK